MAKALLEELTNYGAWQMERYGNIIPGIESTPDGELMNSGLEELNRLAEWISLQSEHDQMLTAGLASIRQIGRFGKRKDRSRKMFLSDRVSKQNNKV
jgi:hypothetical protein